MGSPHKNGNTAIIIDKLIKLLDEYFSNKIIFLKDYKLNPCEGCGKCGNIGRCIINDDMERIYNEILSSDLIVLTSPSYMGGVTSRLKIFMERTWFLRKGQLKRKVGTYIVVGRRKIGITINEIEEYLSRLKMIKIPGIFGFGFEKGEILRDKEVFKDLEVLADQIILLFERFGEIKK